MRSDEWQHLMKHQRRLGNKISVPISPDEHGLTGRECPNPECEGYFKIVFGTGLQKEGLPCHCPYCGHTGSHDEFWTQEQIQYAKSVALRNITNAFREDLKTLEFDHKPRGSFGIGVSMKVKPGPPTPIHYYREKELETEVVCTNCTLQYAVYGVFAFCPDCGQHNSLQTLEKNLVIVRKMLEFARNYERELAEKLIENALEDCVSAFDAFGRELCRVHAGRSSNPARMSGIRFQNLDSARAALQGLGVVLEGLVTPQAWKQSDSLFQKRHLFAHKLGVVDQEYIDRTGDSGAVVGRKIRVRVEEVAELSDTLSTMARSLAAQFQRLENDYE